DLVAVRGGEVIYWPSTGMAGFDEPVSMDGPPSLPAGYREDRLHLVDIDGDGCADLVYLGDDATTVWLNQSGLRFAPPVDVPVVVPPGRTALTADLLGDGRPGFAWSSSSRGIDDSGYRMLRFAPRATAPRLLTTIDNGMGGVWDLRYATSTAMREADDAAG